MRIGELGRRAGVSTRTLRHYEALGLLVADRTTNGYRDYSDESVTALAEIRSLTHLGFTLEETRPFLDCLRAGHAWAGSCPASLAAYRTRLAQIDGFLARLTDIRAELAHQLAAAERLALRPAQVVAAPLCEYSVLA